MHLHHKFGITAALIILAAIGGTAYEAHRVNAKTDHHVAPPVPVKPATTPPLIDMANIGVRFGLVAPPGMKLVVIIDKVNNCSWTVGRDASKPAKAIFNTDRTAIGVIQKTN